MKEINIHRCTFFTKIIINRQRIKNVERVELKKYETDQQPHRHILYKNDKLIDNELKKSGTYKESIYNEHFVIDAIV